LLPPDIVFYQTASRKKRKGREEKRRRGRARLRGAITALAKLLVESHSGARGNVLAGSLWGENF